MIEEIIDDVDIINLCTTNHHSGIHDFNHQIQEKIKKTREMVNQSGRNDIIIQVDGGISFEIAKTCQNLGANCYVLGTKSIYRQKDPTLEMIQRFDKMINGDLK